MSHKWMILALCGLAALAGGGCNRQPYVNAPRLDNGLVLVFTGIEGRSALNESICRGLDAGGVNMAIELNDWTVGVPGAYLVSLRATERNQQKAGEIADRIARYQMGHPGRPVILVGQSGGAAMAVWTAERMPFDNKLDGLVLIAGALSPQYRLDAALAKSRRGIVSFYSEGDWLLLGMGTSVAGTMDGEHSQSAGRVGFRSPARNEAYKKLFQIGWSQEMTAQGNYGGHLSSGTTAFVKQFIAPLVMTPQWDDKLIADVLADGAPPLPAGKSDQLLTAQPAAIPVPAPTTQPTRAPVLPGPTPEVWIP